MKRWPRWAFAALAAVLGSGVGKCIGESRCTFVYPAAAAEARELTEADRLAHAIAGVDSSARRAGELEAARIARLIVQHCDGLDVYEVAALAWKESGFKIDNVSLDGEDFGIFQLRRRWSVGIDAMDPGSAIPGACAKLRRWRFDCARWHELCAEGSAKKICSVHNPKPHHWIAHWAGGTAATKTSGARKVGRRAGILRTIAKGATR